MPGASAVIDLVARWLALASHRADAHNRAANRYAKRDFRFGLPAVILTTIVGSSVFATLQTNVSVVVKIGAGMVVLVAAAFSAAQTFMKSAALSEAHQHTSREYEVLVREIEELQALPPTSETEWSNRIGALRVGFDEAANPDPAVTT